MKPQYLRLIHLLIKLIIIPIIALLTSCEEALEETFDHYMIPKGKHSVQSIKAEALQSHRLRFAAVFDASARYTTQDPINQHDINKLFGFSDCNSIHHENSARFGWRWLEGNLEIHAYVYASGQRESELIGYVDLNKAYNYEIELAANAYVFTLEGFESVSLARTRKCQRGLYYKLFPYFGGNETAPQDILIQLRQYSY